MTDQNSVHLAVIEKFRALHKSGCFLLPNPWDPGTAKYLEHLGFKALASTSAGYAYSRGLPDDASVLSRDMMLGHLRELVNATSLPVNADYQNGYAERPEDVAGNVKLCVTTGVAGLSIEDATRGSVLYERQLAIERVKAARRAIDESELPVVLTARCEVSGARDPNPLKVAVDRLVAFAEAGADCLYAPFISDPDAISEIVRAVAPKPVNVLVWRPGLTVTQLADLGVRRISVGSALSRVAWNAFSAAAKEILTVGSFEGFAGTASGPDLNDLFSRLV